MGQFAVAGCGVERWPWIRTAGNCGKLRLRIDRPVRAAVQDRRHQWNWETHSYPGHNSLDFELGVCINGIENWWPMLHDLNVAIDNAFKEAGVRIAFPQRDVHLDSTGPLDVRVVSEPAQPLKTDRVTKVQ